MSERTVIFLHGFASSGQGTKARYLGEQFAGRRGASFYALEFHPTPKDFEYMTVTGLINRLRQHILEQEAPAVSLIGSSFGGLVALNYASWFNEPRGKGTGQVEKLLLLAPALTYLSDNRASDVEAWQRQGTVDVMHHAWGHPVPLGYEIHVDGRRYQTPPPPPAPVRIIHGSHDQVVPVAASRQYAADYPQQVSLHEVDATHDLNHHLELIWHEVEGFLLE